MSLPESNRKGGLLGFLQLRMLENNLGVKDIALLLARIFALGLIAHGASKATNFEGFAAAAMANAPIASIAPRFFTVVVILAQIGLPLLLLIGLFSRWAGVLMAALFVFIIVLVNLPNGFWAVKNDVASPLNGISFETSLYYFLIGFVVFAFGPGRISLDHMLRRK